MAQAMRKEEASEGNGEYGLIGGSSRHLAEGSMIGHIAATVNSSAHSLM